MEELQSIVRHETTSRPVHPDPRAEDKSKIIGSHYSSIAMFVVFRE